MDQGKLATARIGVIALDAAQASSQPRFTAQRLTIDDLNVLYVRLPNYTPPGVIAVKKAVERMTWPPADLPKLRIDSFAVIGKSGVIFRDDSVSPPANAVVALNTLTVFNIDSSQAAHPADIRLNATINRATTLQLNGSLTPFVAVPDFNMMARLAKFDLPFVSPYVGPPTGLSIRSGTLNADVSGAANSGQLKGDVHVRISGLDIGMRSDDKANGLSGLIGVPIGSVVGLLENNEGVIDLNLPVSGDLTSPSFDFSEAIGKAVTGTLRAAVLAPFKLAAAPVSFIAGLVDGDHNKSKADGLALAPVSFAAGSPRPDLAGQSGVNTLAQVLKQRGTLRLKVCGVATGKDFIAVAGETDPSDRERLINRYTPELQRLAETRALNVREAVSATSGVAADQVRLCDASRFAVRRRRRAARRDRLLSGGWRPQVANWVSAVGRSASEVTVSVGVIPHGSKMRSGDRHTQAASSPAERAPMTSHGLPETSQHGPAQAPDARRA